MESLLPFLAILILLLILFFLYRTEIKNIFVKPKEEKITVLNDKIASVIEVKKPVVKKTVKRKTKVSE